MKWREEFFSSLPLISLGLFQPSWKGVFDNPRMEVSKADMVAQLDKAGVESDVKLIENEPQVKNNFICSFNFQKGWRKYDFWAQDHFRVSSRPLPHWFTSKGTGSRWAAVATGGGSCRDFDEQVVQPQPCEIRISRKLGITVHDVWFKPFINILPWTWLNYSNKLNPKCCYFWITLSSAQTRGDQKCKERHIIGIIV